MFDLFGVPRNIKLDGGTVTIDVVSLEEMARMVKVLEVGARVAADPRSQAALRHAHDQDRAGVQSDRVPEPSKIDKLDEQRVASLRSEIEAELKRRDVARKEEPEPPPESKVKDEPPPYSPPSEAEVPAAAADEPKPEETPKRRRGRPRKADVAPPPANEPDPRQTNLPGTEEPPAEDAPDDSGDEDAAEPAEDEAEEQEAEPPKIARQSKPEAPPTSPAASVPAAEIPSAIKNAKSVREVVEHLLAKKMTPDQIRAWMKGNSSEVVVLERLGARIDDRIDRLFQLLKMV